MSFQSAMESNGTSSSKGILERNHLESSIERKKSSRILRKRRGSKNSAMGKKEERRGQREAQTNTKQHTRVESYKQRNKERLYYVGLHWRLQKMKHVFDAHLAGNNAEHINSKNAPGENVNSFEGRDSPPNVCHIHHLVPNHGSAKGGTNIKIHVDRFDKQAFNTGMIWARWGMYKVTLEWKNNSELVCVQPPVSNLHQQGIFQESVASMQQYHLREDFHLNCWCGQSGILKSLVSKHPEMADKPLSFREWYTKKPRKRERLLWKHGKPRPGSLEEKTLKEKKLRYFEVAVTLDNGLTFGPSKRFYIDSVEDRIERSLLDDDISLHEAKGFHASRLRANKIFRKRLEEFIKLRKEEVQIRELEDKRRDDMPNAERAEADRQAAMEHKEAERKDQERLEAQNKAANKANRELEAIITAQIKSNNGKVSTMRKAAAVENPSNLNESLAKESEFQDQVDIGIINWGNEKYVSCDIHSSPAEYEESKTSRKLHPSACVSMRGNPYQHPRNYRFHVCLQITRMIATYSAGLIDWPHTNAEVQKFRSIFASKDGWFSGDHKVGNFQANGKLSDELDPSSKRYAKHSLLQSMAFGHKGGKEKVEQHIKNMVDGRPLDSAKDAIPEFDPNFQDTRVSSLVIAVSETIIASETLRANELEVRRKKLFGNKWDKLTVTDLSAINDDELKVMFPLQPAFAHEEAVKHCVCCDLVQVVVAHMIKFAKSLFIFPDRRVRDIKVVRSISNGKNNDNTLKLVLHESGIVSMRSHSRNSPSNFAQERISVQSRSGKWKTKKIPAVVYQGESLKVGVKVLARETTLLPWMPGKLVKVSDDSTCNVKFEHLYDPNLPPFVDQSLKIRVENIRCLKTQDGAGGRSGTYTEQELSHLHSYDVKFPDVDNQHIVSSEVIEEYHETEANLETLVSGRSNKTKIMMKEVMSEFRPSLPSESEWPRSNCYHVSKEWIITKEAGMREYIKSLASLVWKDVNKKMLGRSVRKSGAFSFLSSGEKDKLFRTKGQCLNVLEHTKTIELPDGTEKKLNEYTIEPSFCAEFLLNNVTYLDKEEAGRARDLAILDRYRFVPVGKEFTDYAVLHFSRESYNHDVGEFEHQEIRSQRIEKQKTRGWFFSEELAYASPIQKVDHISCGASHYCAISAKHLGARLFTWGSNEFGQLGRSTGKRKSDARPDIVTFTSTAGSPKDDRWQPLPKGGRDVIKSIGYLIDSNAMSERTVRVTSICCGPNFTVCSAIGEYDGQTSIYSWGWAPNRKVSRQNSFTSKMKLSGLSSQQGKKFNSKLESMTSPKLLKIKNGIPHDFSSSPPQEILRFRPMLYADFSVSDHVGYFTGEGLNSQRAQTFSHKKGFFRKALNFFPLKLDGFVRLEWKRWKFCNKESLSSVKSKLFRDNESVHNRRKMIGRRQFPILCEKKMQNILTFSNRIKNFGKSCDRAASMKQDLLRDCAFTAEGQSSSAFSLFSSKRENHVIDIDIEPFIKSFIDAGIVAGQSSILEHLCAETGAKPSSDVQSAEIESEKSTSDNRDESSNSNPKAQAFLQTWKMYKRPGKGSWKMNNDVAWFEILNKKVEADKVVSEARMLFSEKWAKFKLVSRELERREYEIEILRKLRSTFKPGYRCDMSDVQKAQKILLGPHPQDIDMADMDKLKDTVKLTRGSKRRSTGLLELKIMNEKKISTGKANQTSLEPSNLKRKSRRLSNPDNLPVRSSRTSSVSSQSGTIILENMHEENLTQQTKVIKNYKEMRYHEARRMESEKIRLQTYIKLARSTTSAWTTAAALGRNWPWSNAMKRKRETQIIKNIQNMTSKLTYEDIGDVIQLLEGEVLNYSDELERLKIRGTLLQSKIDRLIEDSDLMTQCTEDWLFSSIVDGAENSRDFPKSSSSVVATVLDQNQFDLTPIKSPGREGLLSVRSHYKAYKNESYCSLFQLETEKLLNCWKVLVNESTSEYMSQLFQSFNEEPDKGREEDLDGSQRPFLGIRGYIQNAIYSLTDYKLIGSIATKHHGFFLHHKASADKSTQENRFLQMLTTLIYSNTHSRSLNIEQDLKMMKRLPYYLADKRNKQKQNANLPVARTFMNNKNNNNRNSDLVSIFSNTQTLNQECVRDAFQKAENAEEWGDIYVLLKQLVDHPNIMPSLMEKEEAPAKEIRLENDAKDRKYTRVQNFRKNYDFDANRALSESFQHFYFQAGMSRLGTSSESCYDVAIYFYKKSRDFKKKLSRKDCSSAKDAGLIHYTLFGKILHESPWKVPVKEISACIKHMIGSSVSRETLVDYIAFARIIKEQYQSRQDLAETTSLIRYTSKVHIVPAQVQELEVHSSFETSRLEKEQQIEERQNQKNANVITNYLRKEFLSESKLYLSDSSNMSSSDEEEPASVSHYKYRNNSNKKDPLKFVNL